MYSWSKNWPTLTEMFFGKGINPATDRPYGKITKEKPVSGKTTDTDKSKK